LNRVTYDVTIQIDAILVDERVALIVREAHSGFKPMCQVEPLVAKTTSLIGTLLHPITSLRSRRTEEIVLTKVWLRATKSACFHEQAFDYNVEQMQSYIETCLLTVHLQIEFQHH
jgi:hypothetical protein